MREEINLATGKENRKKLLGQLFSPYFIFFAVAFSISAVVIAFSFFLKLQSSSLSFKAREAEEKIQSLSKKRDKMLVSQERLASIRSIITSRNKLDSLLSEILSQIPDSFSFEAISATSEELVIVVTSDSLSDFSTLLKEKIPLISSNKVLGVKNIKADSFSQEGNGYSLSLTFSLKGDD